MSIRMKYTFWHGFCLQSLCWDSSVPKSKKMSRARRPLFGKEPEVAVGACPPYSLFIRNCKDSMFCRYHELRIDIPQTVDKENETQSSGEMDLHEVSIIPQSGPLLMMSIPGGKEASCRDATTLSPLGKKDSRKSEKMKKQNDKLMTWNPDLSRTRMKSKVGGSFQPV